MCRAKIRAASISLVLSLGLLPTSIDAHHGTNISYDRTTTVTIKGVVAEFWYRNPHPALFINVTDEKGTATRWTIEIAPTPYTLAVRGWNKKRADDALKVGTPVSVKIHAARAGTPVGLLQSITNGRRRRYPGRRRRRSGPLTEGSRHLEHVMRYRPLIHSLVLGSSLLAFAPGAAAQGNAQSPPAKVSNWGYQAEGPEPKLAPLVPGERFDPRDFSGVWETDHDGTNGFRSMTEEKATPPRTPQAQEVYLSRKTARPHDGKKAVEPAFGNDPIMMCNPKGLVRLFMYTDPAEFIHTAKGDRILMTFQSQGSTRSIWMDGRALPVNPEPRWNGYSIGRWEGDTLVIDTIGFDDRAWLDQYGNVYSNDMRFEERWRRVGRDTLEAVYRIDDPASYTRPWVSTTKVWKRQAQELREEFCAPMDELQFNELVRDPAAGVVHSPTR